MSLLLLLTGAPLADLLVGQDDENARIEIVCGTPCEGRVVGDDLLVTGLEDTLAVPLEGGPLTGLEFAREGAGTRVTLGADRAWTLSLASCGPRRVCVEVRFGSASGLPEAEGATGAEPEAGAGAGAGAGAASASLAVRLSAASGDPLGDDDCAEAQSDLGADPWNLAAFRQVAQCRAISGASGEGVRLLSRLLEYRADAAAERALAVLTEQLEGGGGGG